MFLKLRLIVKVLIFLVTFIVAENIQKPEGKAVSSTILATSNGEPVCADLNLFSEVDNHGANFSLQSGEQSYTRYTDFVSEQFPVGVYNLTVNVKWGCTFLACTKRSLRCDLLNNGYEPFEVTESNPVESVFCQCEWRGDNCPPRPDCKDESEDISKAGQCGRGYQQRFCGNCPIGYLSMSPDDTISKSHPQHDISSLTLRKDCRLWVGDEWIDQLFGNVKIDPDLDLICNCSKEYFDDRMSLPNTTDVIDPRFTDSVPDSPNTAWIPYLTVGLSLCLFFVISVAIMYKFKMRKIEKLRGQANWFNNDSYNFEGKVIPPEEITIIKDLSSGKFGVVRLADWKSANANEVKRCVLKTAKESQRNLDNNGCRTYSKLLLQEYDILSQIGVHENIVEVLGVYKSEVTMEDSLVLEYYENQDLCTYMRTEENRSKFVNMSILENRWKEISSKPEDSASFLILDRLRGALVPKCFSTLTLLLWARDLAAALEFLVSKRVLHLDLAARNIFIGKNFVAKLGDFGLAKILSECSDNFHVRTGDYINPLEWVAPEVTVVPGKLTFSVESEIWAYGVTVWEIFSLGADPYPGIDMNLLHQELRGGYRMGMPSHATEAIHRQILECWNIQPDERPNFQNLKVFFKDEAIALENLIKSITADAEALFCAPPPPKSYLRYEDLADISLPSASAVPETNTSGIQETNVVDTPEPNISPEPDPSTSTNSETGEAYRHGTSRSDSHELFTTPIQDSRMELSHPGEIPEYNTPLTDQPQTTVM